MDERHARAMREFIVGKAEGGIFRVNRRVFTDPAIFKQERRDVFGRCWLHVGRVSEVPKPFDFRARRVAGPNVILLRR
jgi:p-cumate 2,3-dioxygenase subunit alpha